MAVTLFHFPDGEYEGDIDNSIKLVLDSMNNHIYVDDRQVDRIVVQKFEQGNLFEFVLPSQVLRLALVSDKPVLFVRISNDPFGELS